MATRGSSSKRQKKGQTADDETISSSQPSSSKRNPLVRSLRAKSTSSSIGSTSKKRSEDFTKGIVPEADELLEQCEAEGGLTPVFLTEWILSKGEKFGSVYLLPFWSGDDDSEVGYRYRVTARIQPQLERHFHTLSLTGVTSFLFGDVRFLTLDQWVSEYRNFEKLRTIPFFHRFKKTKSFQTWKRVVKRQKFISASQKLTDNSCIFGNSKMRHCFLQVQSLVGRLVDMGITEILPRKTYEVDDFFARQKSLVSDFATNFGDFRNIVCQLVLDTCRSTFSDAGFIYEEYSLEVAYSQKQMQKQYESRAVSVANSNGKTSTPSRTTSTSSEERPKKLSFIQQVNKRKVCENLVRFIRLIDFMMRYSTHMIVSNSLLAIQKEIGLLLELFAKIAITTTRILFYKHLFKMRPSPGIFWLDALVSRAKSRAATTGKEEATSKEQSENSNVDSDTEIPVFSCKITLEGRDITIAPDLKCFEDGFLDLLAKLNESVLSVPVLFEDATFNPFTQPILYGKIENYRADRESTPFIKGHEEVCNDMMDSIKMALIHAFEVCDIEMEPYKATASEFSNADKSEDGEPSQLVDVETDVDSLKSKLSNLTDQQSLAKGIKDTQNVSIFRADFRPLKRTILPNISKTIIQLQDALPKLGREKMENFNEDCKSLKDIIDFEFKTADDYVNNMDIKEKMQQRFEQLEQKLEAIENVYQIMKNIPVPVSTEDKNSLKNLKSQLKQLGQKVEEKIIAHKDILSRFAETLMNEQVVLKMNTIDILNEIRSPALLELEASGDEIKPLLTKLKQMVKQANAKVLQYNVYEKKYGFPITAYLELVAAEQILVGINTIWKCTEDWETMYTKWASIEFSNLNVEECEEGTAMIELELEEAKEIIGASPMSQDLMNRVNNTTQRLPVLKDLRTEALKERHWKQISEVVGADLTSSGKKITLEVLDKYNVFNFGGEIARIVKAAIQEEQLDSMINDLRNTWTERKLAIKICHGIPTVSDFGSLYSTIQSSIVTLKELGQSRYSKEMKDSLLYWCNVVDKADLFVPLLAETQQMWLFQEVPLTSMLVQDNHPSMYAYFQFLRTKFKGKMEAIDAASSLITAFGEEKDYQEVTDIKLAFQEVDIMLDTALWSLRFDSPRMFLLSKTDLLQMLLEANNDLPAMYKYIDKMYPALSSLTLVEDTNLVVSRAGYHPVIEGVISKDGECIEFSEKLKVRLGVEHWIKSIGLHLKFTLRSEARSFPHDAVTSLEKVIKQWEESKLPTQLLIIAIHSEICQFLYQSGETFDIKLMKKAMLEMKEFSMDTIKSHGFNELKKSREIAKLFLLEYYLDLLVKQKPESPQELLSLFLVRYHWEEERKIFRCSVTDDRSMPFGYEYNGQGILFNPSYLFDKVAYNIIASVISDGMCILDQDIRKTQIQSLSMLYGRPFYYASSEDNFIEALVGAIITNTWVYVQADEKSEENLSFLKSLTVKLEIARKFNESYLSIKGQEIDLGKCSSLFIARSSLMTIGRPIENLPASGMFQRFRLIQLDNISLKMKIRMALLSRGVSDRGLVLFLRLIVDRFKQLDEDVEVGPQCLELKMLNSIKVVINTRKLGIMQKFLNQGLDSQALDIKISLERLILDPDVVDIIRRHAKMTTEFKTYFEDFKNPSMVAAATSRAMVENCILLQASISNFPMTCAVFGHHTNTIRRTIRATQSFLHSQTGCVVYDVCAKTQLHDGATLPLILKAAKESTGLINIYGSVSAQTMSLLRTLTLEYTTLKVVFRCTDRSVLNVIDKYVNCVNLHDDSQYNMMTALSPCFSEKLFGVFEKHYSTLQKFLSDAIKRLQERLPQFNNGCLIHPSEKSFSLLVGTALAERATKYDFGTLLNSVDTMSLVVRESILAAVKIYTSGDVEAFESLLDLFTDIEDPTTCQHAIYGKKANNEELAPLIVLGSGRDCEIFIPTKTMVDTILALHFYLRHNVSVILLGTRGCGKTLAFSKVAPQMPEATVKYLILGESTDFMYEVEQLKKLRPYTTNIVVIENFNPKNDHHVHFAISLMSGRIVYDERKEKFEKLPNLTLFIDLDCDVGELPQNLMFNVAVLHMIKDDNANRQILNETMNAIGSRLPAGTNESWNDMVELLWKWHMNSARLSTYISDHLIFRAFNGILANIPEDVDNKDTFLKYIFSELFEEYSTLIPRDTVTKKLMEFDFFSNLIKQTETETVFYYQSSTEEQRTEQGMMPHHVQVKTLPEMITKLSAIYHQYRGKNFNDRLVLSPHYTRQIISLTRALCRFNTCVIVGPPGCGKQSALTFCAQMLDLDIRVNTKGSQEALIQSIKESYILANNENPQIILVDINENDPEAEKIFDLLNKIFHYYDIPGVFSKEEKMTQLFDEKNEKFEALLDDNAMLDARRELAYRVKENLHIFVSMTPATFESIYPKFVNFFLKCGIVSFADFPEETLVAIAEERFAGMEKDINIPIRMVSKTCAILHRQMMAQPVRQRVTSTQYLDMVRVLPQLLKPIQKKLIKIKKNLQTGIDQVHKADVHQKKLSNEISEKEPEIIKLNTEIEQLNKRLSQERINLERASKAFRKKEVLARKKGEETQELAADAHRNLEHALPSLEAAMQAISNIDKGELMELRSMKKPSALAEQVLESVCILLGVKSDWNSALKVLADSQFIQRLLDFDKDNVPEQICKRIRRYIDNPSFIPDEVGKTSRICSALCMWVRAIDLYTKIFKSIEPKRLRLLQAESELAEAMAALREETDRVAHIESNITSIQSNFQERVKRKSNFEQQIKQMGDRLERAQLLSYSLEEESERWKTMLIEVEKNLQVLVGNTIVTSMNVAYAGCFHQNERRLIVEKWRKICELGKLETTSIPANEFLSPIMSVMKHWIGKFEFYSQNYLSIRMSNKWPLIYDPHGLAFEALRAQSDNLLMVEMNDERLVDILKQAVIKGQEVLIQSFDADKVPHGLRDVFHRKMTERIHSFIGLMGIPYIRKDARVCVDGQEIVSNSRFRLMLLADYISNEKLFNLKKNYNVVMFEYSCEALELQLLRKVLTKIDKTFCKRYDELAENIRHLDATVMERKECVLDILLKSEEDVLDDKSVIVSLKDAKAKVFEILNDLNQEKKEMAQHEEEIPPFRILAQKLKDVIVLLDLLGESDSALPLPKNGFMKLIDTLEFDNKLDKFLPALIDKVLDIVLPSLKSKNRYILQLGSNYILQTKSRIKVLSNFETLIKTLLDITNSNEDEEQNWKEKFQKAAEVYANSEDKNDPKEEKLVKEQIDALIVRDGQACGRVLNIEQTLVQRIHQGSALSPLLLYADESGNLDAVDIITEMAKVEKCRSPQYVSADALPFREVCALIANCKKEQRWLIVDNFHVMMKRDILEAIPKVNEKFRLFFVTDHKLMPNIFLLYGKLTSISLTHAHESRVRRPIYFSLLTLKVSNSKAEAFFNGILRLHEFLVENNPKCDQFRYINMFVKKFHSQRKKMNAQRLQQLICEIYGLGETSELQSILREVFGILE